MFLKLLRIFAVVVVPHIKKFKQPRRLRQIKRHFKVNIREFRKLQRLLQRQRHIKIELCFMSSVLRLFHLGYVGAGIGTLPTISSPHPPISDPPQYQAPQFTHLTSKLSNAHWINLTGSKNCTYSANCTYYSKAKSTG